jgi:oligopeptidase B
VEHDGGSNFIIWTNKDGAINNRLMTTPITAATAASWTEAIPYDESRKIDEVLPFKNFLALQGRQAGLSQLWIIDVDDASGGICAASLRKVDFDEELYEVALGSNKVFDTPYLRIEYSSLTTPSQAIDLDMRAGACPRDHLIKQQEVLNFDRENYVCRRLFATAPDKTQIPMSLVYRKDLYGGKVLGGDGPPTPKPLHLYAYGSYGICIDPNFNRLVLPLLDRGMLYCIAHIRGGGEMGRFWYEEQGKYLTKRNTFSDFVACAEHLVDKGFTTPDQMSCEGRSAGGMLVGAVVNMRPDLFKAVVAGVPFVDVMTTMCDPSIPLTTNEWEEWGNPNVPKYFDYMLSYSPVDNVRAQHYPHILITAGLHDPRVAYWEPAKWASKLRSLKTDDNLVIAKFDLDSGHFSASDRYRYMKEKAYDQAFILDKLGLADVPAKGIM